MTSITVEAIRAQLLKPAEFFSGNRAYAVPLLDAIEARAKEDDATSEALRAWLDGVGAVTLILRDALARQFQHDETVLSLAKKQLHAYPWESCWMALDTCALLARRAAAAVDA